ncbi:hypothetical protein [Fodinibius sediminis]|uniref:Lysylphosphatidylglycerol synthase TM region n=1 Tax=Fodinibius sediminis TaxID=1214077 RepID=A0A521B6X8_9BACT|nr:hypothetical protein [Fodinibius sediminis]SMO42854.1 hypothetical protein SAMN06265218_102247 [Fodinibius sediminis]
MKQQQEKKWKTNLKKGIRYLLQAGIIGYLAYKLYDIGLDRVIDSLPLNPLFYLLFFLIYFSLPVSEIFIYGVKWNFRGYRAFLIFVQKKVLNTDVLGYSGEFYLFYWAREKIGIPAVEAMKFIKDNNILSSLSSTFISVVLLIFFLTQGYIDIGEYIPQVENNLVYLWIALGLGVVAVIGYQFRNYILSVSLDEGLKISGIYTGRLILTNLIQIIQYKIAEPTVPWAVWFSLMAVQIMSTRIPFLPSRSVLYVSVAIEMSVMLNVPETQLVGVLTANLILKKMIGAISFIVTSFTQTQLPVNPEAVKMDDLDTMESAEEE